MAARYCNNTITHGSSLPPQHFEYRIFTHGGQSSSRHDMTALHGLELLQESLNERVVHAILLRQLHVALRGIGFKAQLVKLGPQQV